MVAVLFNGTHPKISIGSALICYRMFTSSLTEEVKALEADIEAVKEKVDDPVICEKLRRFVYAPKEIQDVFKLDAGMSSIPLLITF